MLDNIVPANTFEINNLTNGEGFVYVGKSALVDTPKYKTIKEGSNCLSTFLFGGIVPGRNIRIDKPTEKDPNIFIDAKFFDFQPYSPDVSGSCILGTVQDNSGDVSYYFKTITNNGNISNQAWVIVEASDESFYIGYDGLTYYKNIDNSGQVIYNRSITSTKPESLILKTHKLEIENSHPYMPSIYTHKKSDEYGNTQFFLNKIIAGDGITIKDDGDTLRVDFDYDLARPTPCCDSNYSGLYINDTVSEYSSFTPITCSENVNVYVIGYDFKQSQILSTVQCENGFCNWSVDNYSYSIISGQPLDFNSSSSSSSSQSDSSESSNSSSSFKELHGRASVTIKNLFTEDNPNAPFIPNGDYELDYITNNKWETPKDNSNPNAPYISIEFIQTDIGWQWKAVYGCGFRNGCGDGYSPASGEFVDQVTSESLDFDIENVYIYFSRPSSTFSFNSLSYRCGSPLFVRGMVVNYIQGGDIIWDGVSSLSSNSSSSSSSSISSISDMSSDSSNSSSSSYIESQTPYLIRNGWYYRLKAEETTDGLFMWNLRIMKYSTFYKNCTDDESSDYYRIYDQDYDTQENKVIRKDSQLIVLTLATSGSFDLFTQDNIIQPNGSFYFNEELTNDWVSISKQPNYFESDPDRIELNVDELRLDGPHNNHNDNTHAIVSNALTDCAANQ
jgi:hypothetical protein